LDYPKLDKAVGRSSDKKWGVYNKRKEVRDKIRKEAGTNAVTQIGDKIVPLDAGTGVLREGGIRTYKKVRKWYGD